MMLRRGLRTRDVASVRRGSWRAKAPGILVLVVMGLVIGLIPPLASAPASATSTKRVLGINVLMYPQYGTKRANLDAAKRMFTYVRSLNANTVALCYQLYPDLTIPTDPPDPDPMHAGLSLPRTASGVVVGAATPSPAYLAQFVDLAHASGLGVQLRPLLNEDALHASGTWRGGIIPTDLAAWFTSYTNVLQPYFTMAHQHHVETFSIGAELTSMEPHNRYWLPLITQAQRLTGSEIIYEANWNRRASLPSASFVYDDYQPVTGIPTLDQETVQNLTTKMEANLLQSPVGGLPVASSEAQFSEVAIAALNLSWMRPWDTSYNPKKQTIIRSVQANWFTAACNAFQDLNMRGIYFWQLTLNVNFDPAASADDPANPQPYGWQNTLSSDAIKACFAANS